VGRIWSRIGGKIHPSLARAVVRVLALGPAGIGERDYWDEAGRGALTNPVG
jgi:hypothetical protein